MISIKITQPLCPICDRKIICGIPECLKNIQHQINLIIEEVPKNMCCLCEKKMTQVESASINKWTELIINSAEYINDVDIIKADKQVQNTKYHDKIHCNSPCPGKEKSKLETDKLNSQTHICCKKESNSPENVDNKVDPDKKKHTAKYFKDKKLLYLPGKLGISCDKLMSFSSKKRSQNNYELTIHVMFNHDDYRDTVIYNTSEEIMEMMDSITALDISPIYEDQ